MSTQNNAAKKEAEAKAKAEAKLKKEAEAKAKAEAEKKEKVSDSAILGIFGVNGFIRAYSKDVHGDKFKELAKGFIAKKDEFGKKSRKMSVISKEELEAHTEEVHRQAALREAKNRKDLKLVNDLQVANPDIPA
jgi:hypothetical protein